MSQRQREKRRNERRWIQRVKKLNGSFDIYQSTKIGGMTALVSLNSDKPKTIMISSHNV